LNSIGSQSLNSSADRLHKDAAASSFVSDLMNKFSVINLKVRKAAYVLILSHTDFQWVSQMVSSSSSGSSGWLSSLVSISLLI